MERATVKSVSIKTGTNDKGPWTNALITTTTGAKVGTFEHSPSQLHEGDEFEFEPQLKGDKVNIKAGTFKLLSAASTPAPGLPAHPNGGQPMYGGKYILSEENQIKLAKMERISYEVQSAFKGIMELAGTAPDIVFSNVRFMETFKKALNWADAHFTLGVSQPQVGEPSKASEKSQDTKPDEAKAEPDNPPTKAGEEPLKNVGELLTRASKLDPAVTREDLIVAQGVNDPKEIKDLEAAWTQCKQISASKAKRPKK